MPSRSLMSLLLAGVTLLALTGCGAQPTPTPTPTKTPRPTFTPVPTATPTPVATPTPIATPTPTPDPNLNPLTGLTVSDPAALRRRPLQVVVNNMPIARPQYGLAKADMVFEYIMDGWAVTRFTAVYLSQEAERIGPVRSARLINLYIGPLFDGALAASGASEHVRWLLRNKGGFPYLDIDLDDPTNTVYSTSIGTHWETRLQTSTAQLRQWLQKAGLEKAVDLPAFDFAKEARVPGSISGKTLRIPYPESCAVVWEYDATNGLYKRLMAGEPHKDAASGDILTAANIVVIFTPHQNTAIVEDSLGNTAIQIGLAVEGRALILRDGLAWEGKWRWEPPLEATTIATGDTIVVPKHNGQPMRFFTGDGQVIPLKPGNTWFEVVPTDYKVQAE